MSTFHHPRGAMRRHLRGRVPHDAARRRLRVAVVSGATLVERGIEQLLAPLADRVTVTGPTVSGARHAPPDVVVYDLATSTPARWAAALDLSARAVVLLGWEGCRWPRSHPDLLGADGLVDARSSAEELLASLLDVVGRAEAVRAAGKDPG